MKKKDKNQSPDRGVMNTSQCSPIYGSRSKNPSPRYRSRSHSHRHFYRNRSYSRNRSPRRTRNRRYRRYELLSYDSSSSPGPYCRGRRRNKRTIPSTEGEMFKLFQKWTNMPTLQDPTILTKPSATVTSNSSYIDETVIDLHPESDHFSHPNSPQKKTNKFYRLTNRNQR